MPYLGLEGIVILLETCTFLVRMIFEGILVSRSEIVLTGFLMHTLRILIKYSTFN